MKRSASDVLRRGFDSTVANWPLLLIRLGEGIAMLALVIGALVGAIVPLVLSFSRGGAELPEFDPDRAEEFGEAVVELLLQHLGALVAAGVIVLLVVTIMLAVHAFFAGGMTRVFVDAERYASTKPAPRRDDFRMFTADRWFSGGASTWWRIFWIYNLVWSIGLLIMLLPFAAIALIVNLMPRSPAAIALGCLVGTIGFAGVVVIGIVTALWNAKSVVVCVARDGGAVASVRGGWRELRADFGRHLVVAFIIAVIAIGAAGVLSMFGMGAVLGARHNVGMSLMFAPLQMASSFAQTIVSAAIACWFTACFAALTVSDD